MADYPMEEVTAADVLSELWEPDDNWEAVSLGMAVETDIFTRRVINTVYDSNRTEWVHWISQTAPDPTGVYYPYATENWKVDSYSWQVQFDENR